MILIVLGYNHRNSGTRLSATIHWPEASKYLWPILFHKHFVAPVNRSDMYLDT